MSMSLDTPGTGARPEFVNAAGTYDVTVQTLSYGPSRNPNEPKGTTVLRCEFLIASSTSPEVCKGETRVWISKFSTSNPGAQDQRAFRDAKCLLFALSGVDPQNAQAVAAFEAEIAKQSDGVRSGTQVVLEAVGGELNPFAGKRARLRTEPVPIKSKPGSTFTKHHWAPAPAVAS